jgi:hypothetical protein
VTVVNSHECDDWDHDWQVAGTYRTTSTTVEVRTHCVNCYAQHTEERPAPDACDIQRALDDLKYQRSATDAKLRRIDARIADLRQQLKDFNEEEWA